MFKISFISRKTQTGTDWTPYFHIPLRALPSGGHNIFAFAAESPYEHAGPETNVVLSDKKEEKLKRGMCYLLGSSKSTNIYDPVKLCCLLKNPNIKDSFYLTSCFMPSPLARACHLHLAMLSASYTLLLFSAFVQLLRASSRLAIVAVLGFGIVARRAWLHMGVLRLQ